MNWKNVNLNSPYECSQEILDGYDFDTLLLEINCNIPDINRESVKKQALYEINLKYKTALEILDNNLDNIVNHAKKQRAKK